MSSIMTLAAIVIFLTSVLNDTFPHATTVDPKDAKDYVMTALADIYDYS